MYGNSLGTIVNCGVEGGTISGANSAGAKGIVTGGITGRTNGIVDGCYNKATISSTNSVYNRQDYGNATAGGIIGQSTQVSKTLNCYNTGSVTSIGEYANACGISGGVDYRGGVVENCYNIGKISGSGRTDNYFSGISRTINSWTSNTSTRITNCYCSTDTNYAYFSGRTGFGTGRVASETIKTYATTLGPAYENDDWNINDGYPILWWEAPTIQLNKRQAYINKNEQLQLSIVGANCNVPVPELENLEITNFKWTSSNEDIATVTGEGLITGLKEGYTTIYGKYTNAEGKEIYAMCIVNVADENQVAMPQVETGENFTTILKPDGTVWTIGNGNYGKLGIGNTEESIDPQQVKISETEDLTNVVKIAVGANHVLALTKDREVYAWGDNTYGQLGTNSTEPSNYAIKVSGEGGSSTLNRIIDISAGQYGSSAINEFGWVYAWGDGTYGEMGNGTTKALNSSPVKTVLNNGITVSTGAGHNVELAQNGKVFTWGRNNAGQLGIGSTSNSTTVLRAFSNATEISASGCETVVKDIDKKVYVAGLNTTGQLGDGKYANITKLTETILPEEAAPTTTGGEEIEEPQEPQIIPAINPVKYIKAGTGTIAIQLKDGAVYTIGFNTRGQLGNGENTNKTEFIRAQAYLDCRENLNVSTIEGEEANNDLNGTIMIGRSTGESTTLNIATVNENGRIYTSGANTNAQIGNHSKKDINYFMPMGYVKIDYPEEIKIRKGESKELTQDDLQYLEEYFNIYNKEDRTKSTLIEKGKIADEKIATYEGTETQATIQGIEVGETILVVKDEETQTLIYIPVKVLPKNTDGTVVPDVKTGDNFTIALKSDGTVWSFGTNTNGELGIGETTSYKNVPTQVTLGTSAEQNLLGEDKIEQISVGNNHVIVLTEEGKVYTWGLNGNGQLGNGTKTKNNKPQEIAIPKEGEIPGAVKETVIKVIANNNTSYAITAQGKIYAWGEGFTTKPTLLDPSKIIIDESTGTTVEGSTTVGELQKIDIIDLTKTYMLDIEGNIYNRTTGNKLSMGEKIDNISEGINHTVFLSETGKGYAIGNNTFGQLGDGTNNASTDTVVQIELGTSASNTEIVKLEAGDNYTIAVQKDGTLLGWGINRAGQLGQNNEILTETTSGAKNTKVAELLGKVKQDIMLVDAGGDHVAIALTDGNVYSWGLNTEGELGNGTNTNSYEPVLVGKNIVETNINNLMLSEKETFDIDGDTTYFNLLRKVGNEVEYESKDANVIAVNKTTGEATARKQGKTVIVAKERGTDNISVIQVRVLPEGIEIEPEVVTSGSHTVALKVDGTVWCYGNNTKGELGDGTTNYSDEPVQAKFSDETKIIQIGAGENFSVALDSDGNVWTWGANDYYQQAMIGVSSINITPRKVTSLKNIKKIACGSYSVLAIDENKEVYGWGLNSNGELGIGSYTNMVSSPTKAKNITEVIDVEIGKNHSIALRSTGEVYVTGLNMYGQLGNGSTDIKKVSEFTKVEGVNKVARIGATESGNITATVDGKVYTWGLNIYGELGTGDKENKNTPTEAKGLSNVTVVDVDGGKNHSIVLDKNGKVYLTGANKYGQLGDGTTDESTTYKQIVISDVMTVSAGNTYTAMAKTDGTVWGNGDYNHGDKNLKSKTCSLVPMQVGNDAFGLGVIKITVKKGEKVSLAQSLAYSFNLIYLDKNNKESITYESLKDEIATVTQDGEVEGVEVGFTWVKATEENGKEHVVYVYVIDEKSTFAPEVSAGEDFATVLKGEGSIWTFGHNNNGELGIGSNTTKDIPERTNINSTYKEISSGNNFTIALRNDGAIWSYGRNNYGQLGIGNTENILNPIQITGIKDIVQIATGKEHAVALDSYGILYGWGRNSSKQLGINGTMIVTPTIIPYTGGTISSIWAGESETVIINTQGNVYGYGSLLNGVLAGIDNAVKVSIGKGYMLILTTEGKVYKYNGTTTTEITGLENIVDIDVTGERNIAQTVEGEVYTWTGNGDPVQEDIQNIYTIGAGENDYYVIKTNGTVYAKGKNEYGQLGNSTRIASDNFTLVGDRNFEIEPETKTMNVGDTEDITTKGNRFNVFNFENILADEYEIVSDNTDVVLVQNAQLQAKTQGTAHVTVTDKVTGEKITLTRIVVEPDKDRILEIKVDNTKAELASDSTKEEIKYEVKVVTDKNTGVLQIKTNNPTDRIKVHKENETDEDNWSKETWTNTVDLQEKVTEFIITVQPQNNNGDYEGVVTYTYKLKVEKISDDVQLEKITVTSTNEENGEETLTATPVGSNKYEVVVGENTEISDVTAIARSNESFVSIDGLEATKHEATTKVTMKDKSTREVIIVVKTEAGTEVEYTLIIHKQSEIMNLLELKVNGKEPKKISETGYAITVEKDCKVAEIQATVASDLANISIANNDYQVRTSTRRVNITQNVTEVSIKVMIEDDIKEYVLYIYREEDKPEIEEDLQLDMLLVNGVVIEPEEDNVTYIVYLPSPETEATIRAIAKEETTYVQVDGNEKVAGDNQKKVKITQNENTYTVTLTNAENERKDYTVKIRKAEQDVSLDRIYVTKDGTKIEAELQDDGTYLVKVPADYTEVDVTAIAKYIKAKVQVAEEGEFVVKQNTAHVQLATEEEFTEVKVKVQSEDGTNTKDYLLKIKKLSNSAELEFVQVDGEDAVEQVDGTYLINLKTAKTKVQVLAQAVDEDASVRIEDNAFNKHATTEEIIIDSKETIKTIYVKAEDGTEKKYTLIISGLPDDATLEKVTVNGQDATYVEGENKYEIRLDDANFHVEATATDPLSYVGLNEQQATQGSSQITVEKNGEVTIVKIKVTAQDGVDSAEYTLEIKEKSKDATLQRVIVNGKDATVIDDENYEAGIKASEETATITIQANDRLAKVALDGETNETDNITVQKTVSGRETTYTITVTAENGEQKTYKLKVIKLSDNTDLQEVSVITTKESIDPATGTETKVPTTVKVEKRDDGTYHLKIDRVSHVDVKAIAQDINASVAISSSAYQLKENQQMVTTIDDITTVIIRVQAEDGTIREHKLILEKKSKDTSIKVLETEGIEKVEGYTVYVDEGLDSVDLTIETINDNAQLKLSTEEDSSYTTKTITRQISLASYTENGIKVQVTVKAEDGTTQEYTITIIKIGNANLETVKAEDQVVPNEDGKYKALVSAGDTTNVEITAESDTSKIEIIKVTVTDEGTTEEVIAQGTGTLTKEGLSLEENPQNYIIRVTSAKGTTKKDYELIIRQKSTEIGIDYVKVNEVNAIKTIEGEYISEVSKKEEYPVQIRAKDANAEIKIAYNGYEGEYQKGILKENVPVAEGETLEVTITVKSENGETQEYKLYITRKSDNTELEYVKVDGELVTDFNEKTNTYTAKVAHDVTEADLNVRTVSEKAEVEIETQTKLQEITTHVTLAEAEGESKTFVVQVKAEDGTIKEYYVIIQRLSANVELGGITVNGKPATKINSVHYEAEVKDTDEFARVVATAGKDTSSVSINGEPATPSSATKDIEVGTERTIEVEIKVQAEDGTEESYYLTITVLETTTDIEYVKVNKEDVEAEGDKVNYKKLIPNESEEANVEIKVVGRYAQIEITNAEKLQFVDETNTPTANDGILNFNVKTPDEDTIIKYKVTSETGDEKEYTLTLTKLSADNSLSKVTVNNVEATRTGTYSYEVTITDEKETAEVIAIALKETSSVSVGGDSATEAVGRKTYEINGQKVIETTIVVISQTEVQQKYTLKIHILNGNNSLAHVRVNDKYVTPEEDYETTYREFIPPKSDTAKIEIKAQNEKSTIEVTNTDEIAIVGANCNVPGDPTLTFNVETPDEVTTIVFKVTSEIGEEKEYKIILTKQSEDNSLFELTVDGEPVEVGADGNYHADVDTAKQVEVKATTTNEYATVRIDYGDTKVHETEATVDVNTSPKKVTITVISQSGETARYYLYIRILENSTELDRVVVDSEDVTNYDYDTKTYTAIVENGKDTYNVFLMAVNQSATVELYDGEQCLGTDTGNLTCDVTLEEGEESHNYIIKVYLEDGSEYSSEYTLEVLRMSNDTSLKLVEVDDIERHPTEADHTIYEVGISKKAETAKIRVQSTNKFAMVQISDYEKVRSGNTVNVKLSLTEQRITVPVVVTAIDGTTDTFNIILIRQSDDATIGRVIVNDTEVQNVDGVYTYYMPANEYNADVEIYSNDENSTIEVDGYLDVGCLQFDELFDDDTIKVEKKIKITSEDGSTQEEYTLILYKQTQIIGAITTENLEQKYTAKVKLYKRKKDGSEEDAEEVDILDRTIDTEDNGTYVMDITEVGTYKVVVEKPGYLSYTVADIEITPGLIVEIKEHKLLAGDVVQDGEIELDDLVNLNANLNTNLETTIDEENTEEKSIYDFNEDGTIDLEDRKILQKNYGKKNEVEQWVKPISTLMSKNIRSIGTFSLPLKTEYRISSKYGERENPVTGENKLHAGIDLVGEHHGEILSIADGVVTYAGVQNGYGNCIEIKHIVNGETIYSFYAHLSEIKVKVGEKVNKGAVIGLEGGAETDPNHGTSTGHHLHFEIRTASGSGHSIDPTKYIEF